MPNSAAQSAVAAKRDAQDLVLRGITNYKKWLKHIASRNSPNFSTRRRISFEKTFQQDEIPGIHAMSFAKNNQVYLYILPTRAP